MQEIVKSPSKHYSPLRYPGGKAGLSGYLSTLIKNNNIKDCTYVEPYAGGAGAALTLLFLEKVDCIIINDLDKAIYSFWKSILTHTDKFVDKIKNAKLTIAEWHRQREIYRNKKSNQLELGFAAFYLNRTNRSGIIEGGPIGGINQTGKWLIDARFNKTELISRIRNIASYKARIKVTNKDGIELLKELHKNKNYFIYLDPPYYVKGSCLYLNHYQQDNHEKLANFLNKHNKFYWVLTYDNVSQIKDLYSDRRLYDFSFNYHIDLPKLGREILVLSDKINWN
ncbi:MAG: DNA adenine methylase [Chitinophagaceae bacterium]|nr:DNA adenine methylase [Chitinophagaceae bacterium]